MIKIDKSNISEPEVLLTRGVLQTFSDIAEYGNDIEKYSIHSKDRLKFNFDTTIYGHEEVKNNLILAQNHKCCFCESKITHISYGDIEHYRPKAAYRQDDSMDIVYPGYYWLAYTWSNLFLACQICNGRRGKSNFFPLKDISKRVDFQLRDISNEEPLFINPEDDEPEEHIFFHGATPEHKTEKGRLTIYILKLDREELEEKRRAGLNIIRALEQIVLLTKDSANYKAAEIQFNNTLQSCTSQTSEYCSMYKSNFQKYLTFP